MNEKEKKMPTYEQASARIDELCPLLTYYSKRYYVDDDPVVSDGEYELLCHTFPIAAVEIGRPVSGLSGFSCGNEVRAENPHCGVTKLPPYFDYHMTGILFSKQKRIVRVGGLEISMDAHIPNDLSDSEYVSFDVQRVDLDN